MPFKLSLYKNRKTKTRRPRAADILEDFIKAATNERISLAEIMQLLGHRAFGVAILFFAIANLLIANVPGISTILGLPIILLALQMVLGQHKIWLPKNLANRTFDKATLARMVDKTARFLRKIEHIIRPRLLGLTDKRYEYFLGVIILLLGIVLALPIVFGNWLPAWALAFIALGMIERDGACVLLGLFVGALAFLYAFAFYSGMMHLVSWMFQ